MDLQDLRKKKCYTQNGLAKLCGVTQQAIQQYENGSRRPSPEVAIRLGELLGFEWTRFFDE